MKITKITFGNNYSKFALANISIQFEGGISLYGVEVKEDKNGKLFLSHQTSYKNKEGKTAFTNHSFISKEIAESVIEAVAPKLKDVPSKNVEVETIEVK